MFPRSLFLPKIEEKRHIAGIITGELFSRNFSTFQRFYCIINFWQILAYGYRICTLCIIVGRLMDYSICRLLYVVFVCVSRYHTITLNKSLVLEWPTFIDVNSFYSLLQLVIPTFEVIHAAQRLIYVNTS
jgi:hypothetical protein